MFGTGKHELITYVSMPLPVAPLKHPPVRVPAKRGHEAGEESSGPSDLDTQPLVIETHSGGAHAGRDFRQRFQYGAPIGLCPIRNLIFRKHMASLQPQHNRRSPSFSK